MSRRLRKIFVVSLVSGFLPFLPAHAQHPGTGSDTSKTFTPKMDAFDYVKREEMVAMRDGVKLKTFILVPKGADKAPILLARTLVDDQRHAASRTDVLVYETEPLKAPLRIAGQPFVQLSASTSGSDSDWVVKIIDVWPDEVPDHPALTFVPNIMFAKAGSYRKATQRIWRTRTASSFIELPVVQ